MPTDCIICVLPTGAPITVLEGSENYLGRHCPVCGEYFASREFLDDGIDPRVTPPQERHLLQAWVKRHPIDGAPPPILSEIVCANAVRHAPQHAPTEKMEQLLLAYASLVKRPSGFLRAEFQTDYPYAWAMDSDEAQQYFLWLIESGLVVGNSVSFNLSRLGWERVHALLEAAPGHGDTVFVASWFDDSIDSAWSIGIKLAIEDCGFKPIRLKEDLHNEKIDDRIIAAIRSCRFMVADVTGARAAVYYEAGFSHGLGKQVLWTCRNDWIDRLCFDTRQFSHIAWHSPEQLRSKLSEKISALNL